MPRKKLLFVLTMAATLASCSDSVEKEADVRLPDDYEIADVRNLPQDIGAYASAIRFKIDRGCLAFLHGEFRERYYSPWTAKSPVTDIAASVASMKSYGEKRWYGENKRVVPGEITAELLANCDLEHLPSMKKRAVVTSATPMRVLPTTRPFFESADDFPFDTLQNTGLKLNEPIRVLHVSRDGLWLFVESADTCGWVEARDVGYIDKKRTANWIRKEQVVIVRDSTLIQGKKGLINIKAKLGTICPLVSERGDEWEVMVAHRSGGAVANGLRAKIGKDAARRFPLAFDGESITLVGNGLIGKPYGWGEKFHDRDCSSMLRDFFLPFAIWLPRGSYNQINSGSSISLEGMDSGEKERLIKKKGEPFLTLIYMKGHIMLYVGEVNGKALVFQNIWGVNVRNGNGGSFKQVIGKSIISTLNPGSELDLVGERVPERISSILDLTDRCGR